jgi:hypothetical protein
MADSTITQTERLVCQLASETLPLESGVYLFSMPIYIDTNKDGRTVIVPGPAKLEREETNIELEKCQRYRE